MKTSSDRASVSRRRFLNRGFRGAGVLGLASAVAALAKSRAATAEAKRPAPQVNPYAYDLSQLSKTDPKLIRYQPAESLPIPYPGLRRIGFGPEGRFYVLAGDQVGVREKDGVWTREIRLPAAASCLAVSPDGLVYVGLRDRLQVYDQRGQRQGDWESPGPKTWLCSLAAGKQDVFATDAGNRVVLHYNREGKLIRRWGQKDKQKGRTGFVVPSPYFDLELEGEDGLWVANPGCHRLEAYSFDGALRTSWGEPGFAIQGFCGCCNPSYFTRLPDGRFVTSEKGLPRVKVYSVRGEFECVVAGPEAFPRYLENLNAGPIPLDVAVDSTGQIWVADVLANEVRRFKPLA